MRRTWDWIVGVFMIAASVVAGGILTGIIAVPLIFGLGHVFEIEDKQGRWLFLGLWVLTFACLQAAGFYDYYRRRRINYATGHAGVFHLMPRAIQRMRTGMEAPGFTDADTGQLNTLQAPINASLRAWVGLAMLATSVAAVVYGATGKGEWTLILMALGLFGVIGGFVFLVQAILAYAGMVMRKGHD